MLNNGIESLILYLMSETDRCEWYANAKRKVLRIVDEDRQIFAVLRIVDEDRKELVAPSSSAHTRGTTETLGADISFSSSLSRSSNLRRLPCIRRPSQQPIPLPVASGKNTGAASLLHYSRCRGSTTTEPALLDGKPATTPREEAILDCIP
ncbi:hypothetical protein LXL04_037194 [Taraxacum kok-saghyz]